ncbi:MAG: FtsX-like permease family protein [Campylobacterota bacterium]
MNMKLLNFCVSSINRKKSKNTILFFGLLFALSLLISSLFTAFSIKSMVLKDISLLPEITVQKVVGGKTAPIEKERIYEIQKIKGIGSVKERIWGYYYFQHRRLDNGGVNFSVVGIDLYMDEYKQSLTDLAIKYHDTINDGKMILGKEAYETIKKGYFDDFFHFYTPEGEKIKLDIGLVADKLQSFEGSSMMIVPQDIAQKILGVQDDYATDIVVKIPNDKEIENIKSQIISLYPDTRVITKDDIYSAYNAMFDFKGGFFLALFMMYSFALFLLIFEKSSGLGELEKREIATLRAIGWKINDIIKIKFMEHFILIFSSVVSAIILSYVIVFVFDAPIIKSIFFSSNEASPPFTMIPNIEILNILGIIAVSLILYLALVLIPIWRSAIIDPSESLK